MAPSYNYALVRLDAHPSRDERLNVGVIVVRDDGIDVRVPRNLTKISAISAALDAEAVKLAVEELPEIDQYIRGEGAGAICDRLAGLRDFSPFSFSELCTFVAHSEDAYEEALWGILQRLVEPESPRPKARPKKASPLLSVIKGALRKERILARKGEDLTAHRVVPGMALAEGLYADLVLQNGAMHVIETVDASSEDASLRKVVTEIAVSALVLEQAKIVFGEGQTKPQLVYHASLSIEAAAMPSLNAAAHQGTELINWASRDDQVRFMTRVSSLAVPFEKASRSSKRVHASTQHKFSLN
jgi:hypothetical protein